MYYKYNGDRYEGGWKGNCYYGQGTYYTYNGDKYTGQWDNSLKGQGEVNYKDGTKYTCTLCSAGLYPDSAKSSCIPTCGDGLRAGSEACDDGYTTNMWRRI